MFTALKQVPRQHLLNEKNGSDNGGDIANSGCNGYTDQRQRH